MADMGQRFHKIGEFWTHFPDDLEGIIDCLQNAGYAVCETMDGDHVIMKFDSYTEVDYDDDDEDDDDCYSGEYRPSGG